MRTVRVQAAPFDVSTEIAALLARAGEGAAGGIGCFVGTVRADKGMADGEELAALTLEHYPGMTERSLTRIADEAVARFRLLGCTLLHRVGRLAVGEGIVLVLAAAPHRGDALDATAFLIDWLKTKAPFWKCEEFTDGRTRWVEARAADDAAAARWGDEPPRA